MCFAIFFCVYNLCVSIFLSTHRFLHSVSRIVSSFFFFFIFSILFFLFLFFKTGFLNWLIYSFSLSLSYTHIHSFLLSRDYIVAHIIRLLDFQTALSLALSPCRKKARTGGKVGLTV